MSSPSKHRYKRQSWCRRFMYKRLPITKWLPEYNSEKALADVIAGITVGLTVIPQALAYATLAGLDPQDGLYSSFIGCFIYIIFGSCKDITLGPTALLALMTYQQIQGRNSDYAILLCFLTGVVQLVMGLLHLGVLIDFISVPVTVGFTSATSVIIAVSQLKGLLGLQFKSGGFIDTLKKVITNMPNARFADSTLGVSCIAILLLMRKMKDLNLPPSQKGLKKALWLLSTSRNAIVVVSCSLIAFLMEAHSESPFKLTGTVKEGLPSWNVPPFTTSYGGRDVSFIEMCSDLGSSIVLVPVIGVLGNVAIAKAFASGESVDATQELLTLSMANIFGSFVGAMPITGSFSRSAVNHASGVATQFGSLYTGILVILALSLLTPYFYYIPKASLAAVVICAVIFMIEYEVVKPMWRSRRADLVPAFATFAICLVVGVELGILAGVAVNVVLLLYPSARPQLEAEIITNPSGFSYLLVTVGNSLYFPGVEYIRQYVERAAKKQGGCSMPVVIDCRYVLGADFTAAKGLCALSNSLSSRGQPLVLLSPRASVASVFSGAGSSVVLVLTPNDLDSTLQDLTGQIPMISTNERRATPPPNYDSVRQHDDEITEVIVSKDHNNVPLLQRNGNGASKSYESEVNDT
ncbi:sodium-independent sulfate anion transporter [Amyelois transitella]|uniref:sodium-independent sulfate anion transporter n=1 Tax=Amyelois transitella TaxID=680683 RepID=UPI00067AA14E|nr:sodium-independent sulfate anion transporter [Amyelois transitella]XP_013199999.1 sodium-independent sulfate anion transporter [Amyelois transitella]XP_060802979.1 sodium-independent sulfate anion transporter [Amyelois transitella]XP_060802980.1 sodium-independent sulfate anion transporter [Amyelois transitella]